MPTATLVPLLAPGAREVMVPVPKALPAVLPIATVRPSAGAVAAFLIASAA